ncbi:MAG: hypothetical protein P8076_08495 [Gammaproteobacteria bacterium]
MIEMFANSVILFMKGKLFQDQRLVLQRSGIATAVTAILCVVLALVGLPLWAAVIIAALVGGAMQPYLYKDLRYR